MKSHIFGLFVLATTATCSWAQVQEVGCLLEPSADVKLGVPFEGVLDQVSVDRGDLVQRGQLLGRMDASVENAQSRTLAAKLAFGRRKLERNLSLKSQQLIASQDLDEISTNQKVAQLEFAENQARIEQRNIHSPVNGVVVDVYFHRGDLVKQEHVFRVARLNPLYAELIFPARQFGTVMEGQTKTVITELGAVKLKGTVKAVDKVIDAASETFRVRLEVPNAGNRVPSGQRCLVQE